MLARDINIFRLLEGSQTTLSMYVFLQSATLALKPNIKLNITQYMNIH
jgi:hypothetical protein